VLSVWALPRSCKEENWGNQVSSVRESEEESVGREWRFREDLSAEAEEPPLLAAVTRERLEKAKQAGKGLADAVAICELWRCNCLSCRVYKWSINPISNEKPRLESHFLS
jgi:hypothetical protein